MMLYRNTKVKVGSPDENMDVDIVAGFLQGDYFVAYLYIICLDFVLRTWIYIIKENCLKLKKRQDADDIQQNYNGR